MKILIEDLPTGRNVKKITFDIEFEDGNIKTDGTSLSSKSFTSNVEKTEEPKNKINETSSEKPNIPNIDISNREPSIPSSMTDDEF